MFLWNTITFRVDHDGSTTIFHIILEVLGTIVNLYDPYREIAPHNGMFVVT